MSNCVSPACPDQFEEKYGYLRTEEHIGFGARTVAAKCVLRSKSDDMLKKKDKNTFVKAKITEGWKEMLSELNDLLKEVAEQ